MRAICHFVALSLFLAIGCPGFMSAAENEPVAVAPSNRAPLGWDEKIRLGWTQWHHWTDKTAPRAGTDLLDGLAGVGVNVFADWGPNEGMGRHARKLGIVYMGVNASSRVRGPTEEHNVRLAVDRYGLTCPEQFVIFVAEGGDPNAGWNKYGEGGPAYVPCPLEPLPWKQTFFDLCLRGAEGGWLDGYAFDVESYGAYNFDLPNDMLCYCDYCWKLFQDQEGTPDLPRKERFPWLEDKRLVSEYLTLLRKHRTDMFRKLARPVRQVNPNFVFAMYPDFKVNEVRSDWSMQAIAFGLHSKEAPFLVVDATPYWEDHTRPYWEQRHDAYRKAGFRHVLGSWDQSQQSYTFSDVGSEQMNYEYAMAADGFWRWGERVFHPMDWRTFANIDRRLKEKESKLGDFLMRGEVVYHFVTVAEETGATWLERAIGAETLRSGDRHMVRFWNGNTDFPCELRLRFPRFKGQGGVWRLVEPISGITWTQPNGSYLWTADDLFRGVTVSMSHRDEQFIMVVPSTPDFQADHRTLIPSFEVKRHLPRPVLTDPLPEVAEGLSEEHVVYTQTYNHGAYGGATAGGALFTQLNIVNPRAEPGEPNNWGLYSFPGYLREPAIAPDGKHVAAAAWNGGTSQIYLINTRNAEGKIGAGAARNISNNEYRDRTPVFSPNGTRIAFVSDRDGDWDIYTMTLDGTDVRRLTNSPGTDKSPAWSPDGSKITFISNREGMDYDVFVMNADGSDPYMLQPLDGNEYEPIFSPDGTKIACTTQRRWNRCVQISNVDGSDPYYVGLGSLTQLWSISWSPDGKTLAGAFSRMEDAGVVVMDKNEKVIIGREDWDGKRVKKLVNARTPVPMSGDWYHHGTGSPRQLVPHFSGVSFSPDGESLIYWSNQQADTSQSRDIRLQLAVLNAQRHALNLAKQKLVAPESRSLSEHELDRMDADLHSAQIDLAHARIARLFASGYTPVAAESEQVKQKLADAEANLRERSAERSAIEAELGKARLDRKNVEDGQSGEAKELDARIQELEPRIPSLTAQIHHAQARVKQFTLQARLERSLALVLGVQDRRVLDASDPQDYDTAIAKLGAQIDPLSRQLDPAFKMWTVASDGGSEPRAIRGIGTAWPAVTVWAGHR